MEKKGRYGEFGGQYAAETLMNALINLEEAFNKYKDDEDFNRELNYYHKQYTGRPSILYYAEKMTKDLGGAKIYLKREDLNHTGAHKINNVIGQCLLAKRMGKKKVIAETGAGQHGVATATFAAVLGLNPVLTGQFLGFFLGEDGKQLITYDDPARLHWAIIGVAVQLLVVIVMCVVTLRKKKTVHAWSASAARKARPGYVPTIALIAPIIPVVLLVVFNVPIILGFTIGSFYALFVCKKLTSFRGACRVLNKDFYDGVVDTAPLVGFLLMIPMFNKAAELCVPYFNALLGNIIPNNTLVISIVFAILAPLGLFRGPFTLFGCGAATLGILKGIGFPTPYLYALMVIPSITMNVSICMTQSWIAWGVSYSKVSTREHLKMTLPYAWLVCIIMQAITYVMFG